MNFRTLAVPSVFALTSLLAVACGGSQNLEETDTTDQAVEEEGTAQVRFINATNAGADFWMDGESVADHPAGAFNQARAEVDAGEGELTVAIGASEMTEAVTLEDGGYYTVVAFGDANSAVRSEMPTIIVVQDAWEAPPAGESWVRFLHGVPGAGAVTVQLEDGTGLFASAAYGDMTDYHVGPGGTTVVNLNVGGETIASDSVPFLGGRFWTLIAVPGADGIDWISVNEAP